MENTNKDINQALVAAIAAKDAAEVASLLKKGADIHDNDDFPLRGAIYLGYRDIAEVLLKNGANVHAVNEEPLYTAVCARDNAMVDMLLANGASMQALMDTQHIDKESRAFIGELQSREAHAAAKKHAAELKEKAKKKLQPNFHQ
jgi:ankyrin repeat protein